MDTKSQSSNKTSRPETGPTDVLPALSGAERDELRQLEALIKQNWEGLLAAGNALAQIRDKRLYRINYKTFETYCREVWGLGRTHANRLIGAARVVEVLAPIGAKIHREAVARPFVGLAQDQMIKAYGEAQALAGKKPITATHARKAVDNICHRQASRPAKKTVNKPDLSKFQSLYNGFDDLEAARAYGQPQNFMDIVTRLRTVLATVERDYLDLAKQIEASKPATNSPPIPATIDIQPLAVMPVESPGPQSVSPTV